MGEKRASYAEQCTRKPAVKGGEVGQDNTTHGVSLDQILIPEHRQGEVEEMMKSQDTIDLAESIESQGLLNRITVRRTNDSFVLVAGLRRLLALRSLGRDGTGVTVVEANEVQAKILNVHENLKRFNLPWWDQVKLTRILHELRQEEHGAGKRGRPRAGEGKQGWSLRDTAEELGVALGPLSEDINLAKAVEQDPSLRNIRDKMTAVRMVRLASKRVTDEVEAGLPSLQISTLSQDEVFLGSSHEILRRLPNRCFDFCITDPPWINFQHDGSRGLTKDEETLPVFEQLFRVLKDDALVYIFVGHEDLEVYKKELPRLGYTVSKIPLIWHKEGSTISYGARPWEYSRNYELIMLAAKGRPVLAVPVQMSSVLSYKVVPTRSLRHPNQKPEDLVRKLVGDCSYEGQWMIDPFAGSGVTAKVAKSLGRHYIVVERDPDFHSLIVDFLKET